MSPEVPLLVAWSAETCVPLLISPRRVVVGGEGLGAGTAAPYAISGADAFPQQDPTLVKDAVGASHGNFARIRELVEKQPAMARASIDWGFGDWETCIDAAVARRQQADRRFPAHQRRAADDLLGGDDGAARCREGVHRGAARHPEDATDRTASR